jgi:hypothetical protein
MNTRKWLIGLVLVVSGIAIDRVLEMPTAQAQQLGQRPQPQIQNPFGQPQPAPQQIGKLLYTQSDDGLTVYAWDISPQGEPVPAGWRTFPSGFRGRWNR